MLFQVLSYPIHPFYCLYTHTSYSIHLQTVTVRTPIYTLYTYIRTICQKVRYSLAVIVIIPLHPKSKPKPKPNKQTISNSNTSSHPSIITVTPVKTVSYNCKIDPFRVKGVRACCALPLVSLSLSLSLSFSLSVIR